MALNKRSERDQDYCVCVCVCQVITGTAALIPLKTDDPSFEETVGATSQLTQTYAHMTTAPGIDCLYKYMYIYIYTQWSER